MKERYDGNISSNREYNRQETYKDPKINSGVKKHTNQNKFN